MKRDHQLSHHLIAYMLLVSLFLQGCSNFSNSLVPRIGEQATNTPETTNSIAINQLAGQQLTAEGGLREGMPKKEKNRGGPPKEKKENKEKVEKLKKGGESSSEDGKKPDEAIPNYLINTIAYVPCDEDDLKGDSSDEDIDGCFDPSMFEFNENEIVDFPFRTFTYTKPRKKKKKKKFPVGRVFPGNTKPRPEVPKVSCVVDPFLTKLANQAFSSKAFNKDLARLKVSFALNRPRSLSTRRNRCLRRELQASVYKETKKPPIVYKSFGVFWEYPWFNSNNISTPYVIVKSFYKQLKRLNPVKAEEFRRINEDETKHTIPYQGLRNRLKNHQNTKDLVISFKNDSKTRNKPIYFSIIDNDVIDFNGIYSAYDDIYSEANLWLKPIVMATGYDFPDKADKLPQDFKDEEIKAMVPALKFASGLDKVVREATVKSIPLGVYYPEPNLCVLLPSGQDTLPESFISQDNREDEKNGNVESAVLLRQVKDRIGVAVSNSTFVFSDKPPLITTIPTRMGKKQERSKKYIYFNEEFKKGNYQAATAQDIKNASEVCQSQAGVNKWARWIYKNRAIGMQGNYETFLNALTNLYQFGNPLSCETREEMKERVNGLLSPITKEGEKNVKETKKKLRTELEKSVNTKEDVDKVMAASQESHKAIALFLKDKVFPVPDMKQEEGPFTIGGID